MKDIIIRALKTFAQAFFGVLIPEVVVILQGGFPESWSVLWAYLSPVVAAALAAAISAVWNGILTINAQKPDSDCAEDAAVLSAEGPTE